MQLLPNGKQTFFDGAGNPLANGKVYFYLPNTSTPATTYQDASGQTANANPVILDGNGQAVIYGTGSYRQVVQDANGVTVWDQTTTAPDAGFIDLGNTTNGKGADLVANAAKKVASIAALRALRVPQGSDAQTVFIDNQDTPIIWSATSTAADDGGTVFMPNSITSGTAGRWLRVFLGAWKPAWFGAVGNGSTDDASALQSLFNTAPDYAEIDLGGKAYFISAGIVSANKYQLVHNGKILWTSTANQFNALTVRDGTTVLGVHFYGSGTIGTSGTPLYQRGVYGGASSPAPALAPANNVKVLLCRFENMTVGVWSGGQGTDAVPTGWKVINNHFENIVGYRGNSEGYGCLFTPSSNGVIAGNTFKTMARHAIYLAGGACYNEINGNVIDTTDNVAIQLNTYNSQPVSQYNKVIGNIINNVTKSIAYGYRSSVGIGLYGKNSYTTIENNTITGYLDTGIDHSSTPPDATSTIAGVNNIIQHNYVNGSSQSDCCIRFDNPDGLTVRANTVIAPNNSYGMASGSSLTPAMRSVFRDNTINCGTGTYGFRLTSTGVAHEFINNLVTGGSGYAYDTGSGSIFRYLPSNVPGISTQPATSTLTAGISKQVQIFNAALTAGVALTLSATASQTGAVFRVVRNAAATGAFNVDVKDPTNGIIKSLTAAGQWAEFTFDGTYWSETGYGTL